MRLLAPALAALAGVMLTAPSQPTATARPQPPPAAERPNIVVITTDDQMLSDLRWMPHTRDLLGGHGVTYGQSVSPHPLCCPARAELLTGQYAQNNGVVHNDGVHGGARALRNRSNTLGRWLHDGGYNTAMVGKFLNGFGPNPKSQVGWTHWNPTYAGVYSYRNTTYLNDGRPVVHRTHADDVTFRYARGYLEQFSRGTKPFFVWVSGLAPHTRLTGRGESNPLPADRHAAVLSGARNPSARKPSYAVPVVGGPRPGIPWSAQQRHLRGRFLARIRSLQAVDEGVASVVRTLRRTGELGHTWIVFTSDNGYLLGEHGYREKNQLFDEALRVPLIVRTPASAGRRWSSLPVTSVDLAPTIADLAGVRPQRTVDGASFLPDLLGRSQPWRDTQLVQTGRRSTRAADPGWMFRGVRTDRWTYGRRTGTGFELLLDRRRDPHELVNLAGRTAYADVVRELRRRTVALSDCAGPACRQSFGDVSAP